MSSDDLSRLLTYVERQLDMALNEYGCCPVCGDHWISAAVTTGECFKSDCGAKWIYHMEVIDYGKMHQVHKPGGVEEKEVNRFELMEF